MNPIRLDLMQRQAAQRCLFDAEVSMNPIRLDLMQLDDAADFFISQESQ